MITLLITLKTYFREIKELENAVKDGYCEPETAIKRMSVYNSQLTQEQWQEVLKIRGEK